MRAAASTGSAGLLLAALVLAGPLAPALPGPEALEAQEEGPWNPEVRHVVALVPEATSTHRRADVHAGMARNGYPAIEVEFTGPSGPMELSLVFDDPETGRAGRMLENALAQGAAEPWDFHGAAAYRIMQPARAPGQGGVEQRLLRIQGGEVDAWVFVAAPGGQEEALDELLEALDVERITGMMDERAAGSFRRAGSPVELPSSARVISEGGAVSFRHPGGWAVTDVSERFVDMDGPIFLVSRAAPTDSMFAVRPEPLALGDDAIVFVRASDPIHALEERITSNDVNRNLFTGGFEGLERPHRVTVEGRPAMMGVYAGTDADGRRVVNRHVVIHDGDRELSVAAWVAEDEWAEVAPLVEAVVASLRVD